MRIWYYSESFKPHLSGVTVSMDTFAAAMARRDHEVTVCAPLSPGHVDEEPYRVLRFPSLGTRLYPGFRVAIPFSRTHRRAFRAAPPEVIHSHSPYQLGHLAQFLARAHRIPLVYHFHTLFTEYLHFVPVIPSAWLAPIVRAAVRRFCSFCDLILVPTEAVRRILVEEYRIPQRIEVLPTGVEDERVERASAEGVRARRGIAEDAPLLVYCGRLSKEKNIEFLLRCMVPIRRAAPDARLMIVAFGPHQEALEDLARELGVDDVVIFTGRVDRDAVYDHLKASDLFVCASKTETQGLVVSEAKACGIPAVGIDAAGVSAMIDDGEDGYLVPEDEEAFVGKVLGLLEDRDTLAALSRQALANARARYLTSTLAARLEGLYDELIRTRVGA